MLFFKKKKEKTSTEIAILTENALADNFNMLFNMYTSCIREDNYDKVGNEATSMMRAYDRIEKVKEMYENELTICANDEEYAFVAASEDYVLAASELLLDIFKDVVMMKKNMKEAKVMGFEGKSKEEIDKFRIDPMTVKEKLPSFDERRLRVNDLKLARDAAYAQLN